MAQRPPSAAESPSLSAHKTPLVVIPRVSDHQHECAVSSLCSVCLSPVYCRPGSSSVVLAKCHFPRLQLSHFPPGLAVYFILAQNDSAATANTPVTHGSRVLWLRLLILLSPLCTSFSSSQILHRPDSTSIPSELSNLLSLLAIDHTSVCDRIPQNPYHLTTLHFSEPSSASFLLAGQSRLYSTFDARLTLIGHA